MDKTIIAVCSDSTGASWNVGDWLVTRRADGRWFADLFEWCDEAGDWIGVDQVGGKRAVGEILRSHGVARLAS